MREHFIENKTNTIAVQACQAVAGRLSSGINPLWICGKSGCGKSHLLKDLYRQVKEKGGRTILLMSGEELQDALLRFYCKDSTFWKVIEAVDLLVIDNMEELCGSETIQEVAGGMLLEKCQRGEQVVLASSCLPAQLKVLSKMLEEEAEQALYIEIDPPDEPLRLAYAKDYLKEHPFGITQKALEDLAVRLRRIPQIKGAMQTAALWSEHQGAEVDQEWVENYMKENGGDRDGEDQFKCTECDS